MQTQDVFTPPLTYDDLVATPDDGKRYEIIDGELFVGASPRRVHQESSRRIYRVLDNATESDLIGRVYFAPVDVRLSPHDIVQPDILFIRRDRLHIYTEIGLVEGPPDIVVEILSPGSHTRDLVKKAKLYAWAGVPEYWQADPFARTLRILTLQSGHYETVEPVDGHLRSTVLPHLNVDIAALFADL